MRQRRQLLPSRDAVSREVQRLDRDLIDLEKAWFTIPTKVTYTEVRARLRPKVPRPIYGVIRQIGLLPLRNI